MKTSFLFAAVICLFSYSNISATSYTWNGGISYWDNPNNWIPVGIPGAGDEIIIYSGKLIVPNGYAAVADAVTIYSSSGNMEVRQTATLTLVSSTANSLNINGYLTNKGKIYCYPSGGTVSVSVSVGDTGTFYQTSSGKLYCKDFQFFGILSTGVVDNRGTIDIDGQFVGEEGISIQLNTGVLYNRSSGKIYIDDITGNGIGLAQTISPFDNYGNIQIKSNQLGHGIQIASAGFNNYNYILVIGGSYSGFRLDPGITATNSGEINLSSNQSTGNGLLVLGNFYNLATGVLKIQKSGTKGLSVYANGVFENLGTCTVFGNMGYSPVSNQNLLINEGIFKVTATNSNGADQLENYGYIENMACGHISLTGRFNNNSGSEVINEGFWVSSYTGLDFQFGDFENSGVVADPYGCFSTSTITNYGVHVRPIPGANCISTTIYDALELGSNPVNPVTAVYLSEKYNTSGGIYVAGSNKLFPDPAAAGLDLLFLEMSGSNGCSYRIPLGFEIPIQGGVELCGDGIDNDCDGLIDEAGCLAPQYIGPSVDLIQRTELSEISASPKIYPNPSSDILQLDLTRQDLDCLIELMDINGKIVFSARAAANTSFAASLGDQLPAGMYLVRLYSEQGLEWTQKWVLSPR